MLDEIEANGQVAYRYAPGQNPNGSARDIAGVRNEAGNVLGLMPHPEHAVDPLTGSTDGLRVFEAVAGGGVAGVTVEIAKHRELGLTDSEFELIVEKLGREPNDVELAMFSLLWSEHCAYKHSRKLLRRLPTEGERVVMGPGENAGAVDVGNGYAVAFKVESHNHPSAVEPFQGAATGSAGSSATSSRSARGRSRSSTRCASASSTRCARATCSTARCAGSATTATRSGWRTSAARSTSRSPTSTTAWSTRCASGWRRPEDMVRAAAAGVGNAVVLMGASTGRDGIGGASVLASAELGEGDEAKRPTVQIGDPFEESKVLECCLEATAASPAPWPSPRSAGGLGCRVDLQHLRERGCSPEEALFGEGTGGFLVSGERGELEALGAVFLGEVGGSTIEIAAGDRSLVVGLGTPRAPGARCRRRPSAAAPEASAAKTAKR